MGRSFSNRIFGGVCGGLADATPFNAWVLRAFFALLTLFTLGAGALVYVLWWWLLPMQSPLARNRGGGIPALIGLGGSIALIAGWFLRGSLHPTDGTTVYWLAALLLLAVVFFVKQIITGQREMILVGLVGVVVPLLGIFGTLGVFPVGLYDILLRAVPGLLVFGGLWIALRHRVQFGGVLALLISVGMVAGMVSLSFSSRATAERTDNTVSVDETISDDITTLQISLVTLDTDVRVVASSDANARDLTAEFVGSNNSDIEQIYDEDGTLATFDLTETAVNEFPLLENIGRGTLQVTVPRNIAVGVSLRASNGDLTMDMAQTNLERLSFNVAQGDALVTLPQYQPLSPNVRENPGVWTVGDGDLRVVVPDNLGVQLVLDRGRNAEPRAPENFDPLDFQVQISQDTDAFLLVSRQYDAQPAQVEYIVDVLSGTLRIVTDNPSDENTDTGDNSADNDEDS